MKKILLLITALVVVVGATSAMAQTPEKSTFFYTGYQLSYYSFDDQIVGNGTLAGGQAVTNFNYEYAGMRLRPYFSYKTENVEATIKLEADFVLGSANNVLSSPAQKHTSIGYTADTPFFFELKNGYIKLNVPDVQGLSFLGGVATLMYAGFGAGYYCEEAAQFRATYAFGNKTALGQSNVMLAFVPGISGNSYRYEQTNGVDTNQSQKQSIYVIEVNIAIASGENVMKITPTLWMVHSGMAEFGATPTVNSIYSSTGQYPYHGKTGFMPGIGFNGVFAGKINVLLNFAYGWGDTDIINPATGNTFSYSGWWGSLDATYAVDKNIKVGIHIMALSGDKNADDTVSNFTAQQVSFLAPLGGKFWFFESGVFSPLAAGNNLYYSAADLTRMNVQGAYIFGLFADMTFMNKLNVYVGFAYAMAAANNKAYTDSASYGEEIDLSISYKIESARIFIEYAVLFTGDAYLNQVTPAGLSNNLTTYFGGFQSVQSVRTAQHIALGMDIFF